MKHICHVGSFRKGCLKKYSVSIVDTVHSICFHDTCILIIRRDIIYENTDGQKFEEIQKTPFRRAPI